MTIWTLATGVDPEALGYLPQFIDARDPRPAIDQLHEAYRHGGGWNKFEGFDLLGFDRLLSGAKLVYPGDPPYHELARTTLDNRDVVVIFQYSWVLVVRVDGSHEIARMD